METARISRMGKDEEWETSQLNARNVFGDEYVDAIFAMIEKMEEGGEQDGNS